MAEDRTEWAEDRTDWAEDRTLMANERTFAAWMRTGLASVGIGIGLNAVFSATEPTWLAKSGATVFLVIGFGIFQLARILSGKLLERMSSHDAEPISQGYLSWIANGFSVATIVVGVILWIL